MRFIAFPQSGASRTHFHLGGGCPLNCPNMLFFIKLPEFSFLNFLFFKLPETSYLSRTPPGVTPPAHSFPSHPPRRTIRAKYIKP